MAYLPLPGKADTDGLIDIDRKVWPAWICERRFESGSRRRSPRERAVEPCPRGDSPLFPPHWRAWFKKLIFWVTVRTASAAAQGRCCV